MRTFLARLGTGAVFLARLGRDTSGNTLAIVAAAMIPLAGLVGGGVDMSRLYLTKTRLQQACDAGALAGRKAMGGGSWTTSGDSSTQGRANAMFNANFQSGAYGTAPMRPSFTEDEGTVNGTATVQVPMTIMRIFGYTARSLTVSCTAKMEIPNTDVMFVLDVTYSMAGSRITGLKSAVKCFYEALVKVNTPEVCDTANPGSDPTATSYNGTAQIRLGFVPYAVNVNVGRLLKNSFMADQWTYQSRIGNVQTVQAWALGNASTPTYGNWSSAPDSFSNPSGYDTFGIVSATSTTLADGLAYSRQAPNVTTSNGCTALNKYGSYDQMVGITEPSNGYGTATTPSYTILNNDPPVHPAARQDLTASQTRQATVDYGYRYRWFKNGNTTACWLERATKKTGSNANKYTQTRTGPASKDISWTPYQHVVNFTYGPRSFNVSALKAGDASWGSTVTLPGAGFTNGPSVKLSGSTQNTTIRYLADATATWDGCIMERNTVQNTDGDPSDEWGTIPEAAYDMNIDLVPSDSKPGSYWGPMLDEAVWGRYSGGTSSRSFNALVSAENQSRNFNYYCSNPARKLKEYKSASEVSDFVSYISGLTVTDLGTYHDIGMLWGGRLISPTGLYASENAQTNNGSNIQRHLIFMTDGNAQAVRDNMVPHGLHFYDRRQTSYDPNDNQLNALTNARLLALCTQIRNKNITLWVISYGGGVDEDNEDRLSRCASPGGHFYSAANGAELRSKFRQIASEIADLRLTR